MFSGDGISSRAPLAAPRNELEALREQLLGAVEVAEEPVRAAERVDAERLGRRQPVRRARCRAPASTMSASELGTSSQATAEVGEPLQRTFHSCAASPSSRATSSASSARSRPVGHRPGAEVDRRRREQRLRRGARSARARRARTSVERPAALVEVDAPQPERHQTDAEPQRFLRARRSSSVSSAARRFAASRSSAGLSAFRLGEREGPVRVAHRERRASPASWSCSCA